MTTIMSQTTYAHAIKHAPAPLAKALEKKAKKIKRGRGYQVETNLTNKQAATFVGVLQTILGTRGSIPSKDRQLVRRDIARNAQNTEA